MRKILSCLPDLSIETAELILKHPLRQKKEEEKV